MIKRSKRVLSADFEKGTVILDLETRLPYILNSVAREIWLLLVRPRNKTEIADILSKKYGAKRHELRSDLDAWLAKMHKKGLVEYVAKR